MKSEYCQWLNDLADLAEKDNIVIEARYQDGLDYLYRLPIELPDALDRYVKMVKRIKAISSASPEPPREYMTPMKTTDVRKEIRGLLYICEYTRDPLALNIINTLVFEDSYMALEAYANIPNPESQLVMGTDRFDFLKNLLRLNKNMVDPQWLKELGNTL